MSGCGAKSSALGRCSSANELDDGWRSSAGPPPNGSADWRTVRDRMPVGAVEARSMSRWRNGSGPGAVASLQPTHRALAPPASQAGVFKGGLEFSAERSLHRVAFVCVAAWPPTRQLHALGSRAVGTVRMPASTRRGWRRVNHRASGPGTWRSRTDKWPLPAAAES